jgi:hypothetical protein
VRSKGYACHGDSCAWQEVAVRLDRVNKALHIRFIPNEKNRLYLAVNYLKLAVVGRQDFELIASVVEEKAVWPRLLSQKLPPGHAGGH